MKRNWIWFAVLALALAASAEGQGLRSRMRPAVWEGLALGEPQVILRDSGTADVVILLASADETGVRGGAGSARWIRLTDEARARREVGLCTAISVTSSEPTAGGPEIATSWHARVRDVPYCAAALRGHSDLLIAVALREHPEVLSAFIGRGRLFELEEALAELAPVAAQALGRPVVDWQRQFQSAEASLLACAASFDQARKTLIASRFELLEWRVEVADRPVCSSALSKSDELLEELRAPDWDPQVWKVWAERQSAAPAPK